MDADTIRRLSLALTVEKLIKELQRMPPKSLVVFTMGDATGLTKPVTDAEEMFPDEVLHTGGAPRGYLRFAEDVDREMGEDDPGVVILS